MNEILLTLIPLMPLLLALALDWWLGDPIRLPHPIVWFGRMIAFCEHRLNKGSHRKVKGAVMSICLIAGVFAATWCIRYLLSFISIGHPNSFINSLPLLLFDTIFIFYCLAGTTLIREVRNVFIALDRSLDEGRQQVARIVGRDTSELSAQKVRTAALETLAENLSDGVIAPLFWYALLGVPGMLAYKMVNTLDSMIGYRTERYNDYGFWAAHIDDIANWLPARLTALLMLLAYYMEKPFGYIGISQKKDSALFTFVLHNGRNHASPNSGYPEAALAGILNCRFGGPHYYFGELFEKPFIGTNNRLLSTADMQTAVRINRTAEVLMVVIIILLFL